MCPQCVIVMLLKLLSAVGLSWVVVKVWCKNIKSLFIKKK